MLRGLGLGCKGWLVVVALGACGDGDVGTGAGATESSTGGGASTGKVTTTGESGEETVAPTTSVGSQTGSESLGTSTADTTSDTDTTATSTTDGETGSSTTGADTTGPAPFCGDGVVDAGEACDEGANNSDSGSCTAQCKAAMCGDALVGPGESCDDGNQVDEDGCGNNCALASCGDGVVQVGESCDDANADDGDACLGTCVTASCGDGVVQAGVEECDELGELCTDCKLASCEDGVKNGAEVDVDCGGADCPKCGLEQACGGQGDCGDGLVCELAVCVHPSSCEALKLAVPEVASGFVVVDLDASGPEQPLEVYCEQTELGGGWMRVMSAKYPHFFEDANWQDFNAGTPKVENYSILGKRDLFKDGEDYTFRYAVGDAMTWHDGPIMFQVAWTQGHDPFTTTTNGADYTFIGGNEPTTCAGFSGLHNKYTGPSYATEVDPDDGIGCWWMQVVPREDWAKLGYPPGYLHGFLGGGNLDPKHETQWEVLYIR